MATSAGRPSVEKTLDLIAAAGGLCVDGAPLKDRLLVPDAFEIDKAAELKAVYDSFYERQAADNDKQARYWTLGYLRESIERKFSFQSTLKHMPSTKFWVDKEVASQFPLPGETCLVLALFSCRPVKTGIEVDEDATLVLDSNLSTATDLIHLPPTDTQVEAARQHFGLPPSVSREAIFGRLIRHVLENKDRKA